MKIKETQANTSSDMKDAVMISLLTDAPASSDEMGEYALNRPDDGYDAKRGYWADLLDDQVTGSKLWMLSRSVCDENTLEQAKRFALESLQWLKTDGLAKSLDVETSWSGEDLHMKISVDSKDISIRASL